MEREGRFFSFQNRKTERKGRFFSFQNGKTEQKEPSPLFHWRRG